MPCLRQRLTVLLRRRWVGLVAGGVKGALLVAVEEEVEALPPCIPQADIADEGAIALPPHFLKNARIRSHTTSRFAHKVRQLRLPHGHFEIAMSSDNEACPSGREANIERSTTCKTKLNVRLAMPIKNGRRHRHEFCACRKRGMPDKLTVLRRGNSASARQQAPDTKD